MRLGCNKDRPGGACHGGADPRTRLALRAIRGIAIATLSGVALSGAGALADDLVLEAAFLADPVPAAGTDVNLSLAVGPVAVGAGEVVGGRPG